jgi:iron complex transport system substrate-binding protein
MERCELARKLFILPILFLTLTIAASSADYPMNITDSAGREISLRMPIERVIVLNADAAQAMSLLGASDKIVGVTSTIKDRAYDFPQLQDRPVVGKNFDYNYELIGDVARKGSFIPSDIIVICFSYKDKPYGVFSVNKNLEPLKNITVVALDFYKQETLNEEMTKLGAIMGKEDPARAFIKWHDNKISEVKDAISGLPSPKVYIESNSKGGLGALTTFGNGSGTDQVLKAAGGYNIVQMDAQYPTVDWEWVVAQSPDVIIKTDYLKSDDGKPGWAASPSVDAGKLENIRNEILSRPGSENISAVKNGRVYVLRADILFGLSNLFGLSYMAKLIHPEAKLDPEGLNNEYQTMSGLASYPENRIFAYPT